MPLEAIAYTSSAVGAPTDTDLERLLVHARRHNEQVGVTGVLLYHDGSFFQYFEGPAEGVAAVYERVRRSALHRGLVEVMHEPVAARAFEDWLMGFTQAPGSTLLQLSNASWKARLARADVALAESEGFQLLRNFWRSQGR
ncbi:MAG: hypothetical protein RL375_3636 [Pseudomonadota bacterium]|jgi:hypothetical protein